MVGLGPAVWVALGAMLLFAALLLATWMISLVREAKRLVAHVTSASHRLEEARAEVLAALEQTSDATTGLRRRSVKRSR